MKLIDLLKELKETIHFNERKYNRLFDNKPFNLIAQNKNNFKVIGQYFPPETEMEIIKSQIRRIKNIEEHHNDNYNLIIKLHEFHPENDVENIIFDTKLNDDEIKNLKNSVEHGKTKLFIQDKVNNKYYGNLIILVVRDNTMVTVFNTNIKNNQKLAEKYKYNSNKNRTDKIMVLNNTEEAESLFNRFSMSPSFL